MFDRRSSTTPRSSRPATRRWPTPSRRHLARRGDRRRPVRRAVRLPRGRARRARRGARCGDTLDASPLVTHRRGWPTGRRCPTGSRSSSRVELRGADRALPDVPDGVRGRRRAPVGQRPFDVPRGRAAQAAHRRRRTCRRPCQLAVRDPATASSSGLPFKLTAGLHHAVAHRRRRRTASSTSSPRSTRPWPASDPVPGSLADRPGGARRSTTPRSRPRRLFRSIGTCSIDEPLAGPARAGAGRHDATSAGHDLPYGSFVVPRRVDGRTSASGSGTDVLDLTAAGRRGRARPRRPVRRRVRSTPCSRPGPRCGTRSARAASGSARRRTHVARLAPADDVELHLPFTVADYVDFYASEHHATNLGRMFRPDGDAADPQLEAPADRLPRPRGHGRRLGHAGAPPSGQRAPADGTIGFGPSARLDIEAEVGFVVGVAVAAGRARRRSRTSTGTSSASASSTTGPPATSRPGSTCRSARSSASRSRPRSRRGSSRWPRSSDARVDPPARDPGLLPYLRDARAVGSRPRARGHAQRHGRLAAAVRGDVLDAGARCWPT